MNLKGKIVKHIESLGYKIPRELNKYGKMIIPEGAQLLIKTEHLLDNSNKKVTKICDSCKKEIPNTPYSNILRSRNSKSNIDGKDRCHTCSIKNYLEVRDVSVAYEDSFKYFAENENNEILKEFSLKNNKKPHELYKNSSYMVLWNCSKCKSEFSSRVADRVAGNGCPYCAGQRVNDTNCFATFFPIEASFLVKVAVGYEVSYGSGLKTEFYCPRCENIVVQSINKIKVDGIPCRRCGDGFSFPEKFLYNALEQSKINFEIQKTFDWSSGKKYDFYLPKEKCIIETHGMQHYRTTTWNDLEDIQENDQFKQKIAIENGIESYIVIDCRFSDKEFIVKEILSSKLKDILDLEKIDWGICLENATNSFVLEANKMWEKGNDIDYIANSIKVSKGTVKRYLQKGKKLGLSNYPQ